MENEDVWYQRQGVHSFELDVVQIKYSILQQKLCLLQKPSQAKPSEDMCSMSHVGVQPLSTNKEQIPKNNLWKPLLPCITNPKLKYLTTWN